MLKSSEWNLISETITKQRQNDRLQQQALFRFFEAFSKDDDVRIKKILETGLPIDVPLWFKGDAAVPGVEIFRPENYSGQHINLYTWAAAQNNIRYLDKLESYGADPFFPGEDGRDAMWFSMLFQSENAWDWFADRSPPWSLRTIDGRRTTRLMDAVRWRCLFAVRHIINWVDLSASDATGRTALHYNFLQNPYTEVDLQIGRLLIEFGAPVTSEDLEGVSPVAMANTPEQQALLDRALLAAVSEEARLQAEAQRSHLEAQAPTEIPEDPSDPGFAQIQKPVQFKKRIM